MHMGYTGMNSVMRSRIGSEQNATFLSTKTSLKSDAARMNAPYLRPMLIRTRHRRSASERFGNRFNNGNIKTHRYSQLDLVRSMSQCKKPHPIPKITITDYGHASTVSLGNV
ncbi:hypothetical protein AB6A40_008279 [Gnathostoma spinigerum]|uniref:Uncharacterized protein n=1 Tax=Gnathostoma spinigerum TaxID=75299 RepID=A0ABD6EZ62_9BILA